LSNPKYVKVDNKLYKINTDFRVAIECNKVAENKKISDIERGLAIIYLLFGEDGLNCTKMDKLLDLGLKYINIYNNKEKQVKNNSHDKFEIDISKCEGLIRSSFKFDYNYDPYELEYLHWYDFYNDLENLSTSEFGTCCALNRIISILNEDATKIKDNKQRNKLVELQNYLMQKYCNVKEKEITKEQEESARKFYKALGIDI
jgi:hypothetical protein